jgi:hypothetical protein
VAWCDTGNGRPGSANHMRSRSRFAGSSPLPVINSDQCRDPWSGLVGPISLSDTSHPAIRSLPMAYLIDVVYNGRIDSE